MEKQRVALEARLLSQAMESVRRGVQEIVTALQAKLLDLSKVLDHYERTTGWPWPSSH